MCLTQDAFLTRRSSKGLGCNKGGPDEFRLPSNCKTAMLQTRPPSLYYKITSFILWGCGIKFIGLKLIFYKDASCEIQSLSELTEKFENPEKVILGQLFANHHSYLIFVRNENFKTSACIETLHRDIIINSNNIAISKCEPTCY